MTLYYNLWHTRGILHGRPIILYSVLCFSRLILRRMYVPSFFEDKSWDYVCFFARCFNDAAYTLDLIREADSWETPLALASSVRKRCGMVSSGGAQVLSNSTLSYFIHCICPDLRLCRYYPINPINIHTFCKIFIIWENFSHKICRS